MEGSDKRTITPSRLRVSTQSEATVTSAPQRSVAVRVVAAAVRRVRGAILPAACLVFVASAALAIAIPPNGSGSGSGVTVDAQDRVTAVESDTNAWTLGVRPGWMVVARASGVTMYGLGSNVRTVPEEDDTFGLPAVEAVAPSLVAILLAGALIVARQHRTGATVAVGAALMSVPVWAMRAGAVGEAVAILPAGLAAALAWQTAGGLGWRPRLTRPLIGPMNATLAALAATSAAALVVGAQLGGLVAGVAAASVVYVTVAWVVVVRWRVTVAAAGPGARSRLSVARAVAFDMLPYSDRVRRRGAQDERDRLASDLHAELLPAIASTAAALEERGATEEAQRLRNLAGSVRDLVSDRRLPILDDRGLVAAAEWLAESLQERGSLTIEIDLRGDTGVRQPQPVERAAYRVLQLALDNVIRHAEAANAFVAIAGDAHALDLAVADDGRGIGRDDAVRALHAGRLGLADMRNEAESVGASMEIAPGTPRGTIVNMRWRS